MIAALVPPAHLHTASPAMSAWLVLAAFTLAAAVIPSLSWAVWDRRDRPPLRHQIRASRPAGRWGLGPAPAPHPPPRPPPQLRPHALEQ